MSSLVLIKLPEYFSGPSEDDKRRVFHDCNSRLLESDWWSTVEVKAWYDRRLGIGVISVLRIARAPRQSEGELLEDSSYAIVVERDRYVDAQVQREAIRCFEEARSVQLEQEKHFKVGMTDRGTL